MIAFAYKDVANDAVLTHDEINDLVMIGLAGIIDPPKESALEAVSDCKKAGVRVVMITGDHPTTAKAIAQQLGINHADRAITGTELDRLSADEWHTVVKNTNIFARTTPEHKLQS